MSRKLWSLSLSIVVCDVAQRLQVCHHTTDGLAFHSGLPQHVQVWILHIKTSQISGPVKGSFSLCSVGVRYRLCLPFRWRVRRTELAGPEAHPFP